MFIKPHAVFPAVEALLRDKLASIEGKEGSGAMRIETDGTVNAEEIAAGSLAQRHYGQLAARALSVTPSDLPTPSDKCLADFSETFGVEFAEACANGLLMNCTEYLESVSESERPGPFDLEASWRSTPCVKLFPGTYAARATPAADAPIVINGFFPAMNAKFTDSSLAPRGIRWFVVSWDEGTMSWDAFRTQFIGATNPAKASVGSLRAIVYTDWEELGLAQQPSGADNSFHASASPVEAAYEMGIWLGKSVEDTMYFKRCTDAGVDAEVAKKWASGAAETEQDGKVLPVFDVCEHLNLSECVEIMKRS